MIYRIEEGVYRTPQKFTSIEPVFQLDKVNGVLVEVGKIDIQEKIQSFESCALDKILDAFLNGQPISAFGKDDSQLSYQINPDNFDPLLSMAQIANKANELRVSLGMKDTATIEEVYAAAKLKGIEVGYRVQALNEQKEKEAKAANEKKITNES